MKFFVIMLLGVVVLGAGLGGGAVAWTILKDDGSNDPLAVDFPRPTVITAPQQAAQAAPSTTASEDSTASSASAVTGSVAITATDGSTQEQLAQLRERLQSGELTQEELAELREQFQGAGGFGGGGTVSFGNGFAPLVGAIETVEGSLVSVGTPDGIQTALVSADTSVSISSETGVEGLELGQQISVVGERDETGSFVASAITVVTAGGVFAERRTGPQRLGGSASGGFGGASGGLGGTRALTGTVDSIEESSITVETEQGPLPVAVNADTIVRIMSQGAIGDLEPGMNVVIIGQPDEDGQIVARSVNVVPEGVTLGAGGAGGLFGGRQRPGGQTGP